MLFVRQRQLLATESTVRRNWSVFPPTIAMTRPRRELVHCQNAQIRGTGAFVGYLRISATTRQAGYRHRIVAGTSQPHLIRDKPAFYRFPYLKGHPAQIFSYQVSHHCAGVVMYAFET